MKYTYIIIIIYTYINTQISPEPPWGGGVNWGSLPSDPTQFYIAPLNIVTKPQPNAIPIHTYTYTHTPHTLHNSLGRSKAIPTSIFSTGHPTYLAKPASYIPLFLSTITRVVPTSISWYSILFMYVETLPSAVQTITYLNGSMVNGC